MQDAKRYIAIILLIGLTAFVLPHGAQSLEVSVSSEDSSFFVGILENIKSVFGEAEKFTAQGVEAGGGGEEGLGGFQEVLGKVWSAIKGFFSDRTARELLIDTFKLFLQVIVNMFVILANLLSRIIGALSSSG